MRFENPANGYVETCSTPFLWALIFGPLYFVLKGVWRHVVLYFIVLSVLLTVASILAGGVGILLASASDRFLDPGYETARNSTILVAAIATFVAPFLIYPFIASGIIRRHFLRMGWTEIN